MTANRRRLAVALAALAVLAFSCSADGPSTSAPPPDSERPPELEPDRPPLSEPATEPSSEADPPPEPEPPPESELPVPQPEPPSVPKSAEPQPEPSVPQPEPAEPPEPPPEPSPPEPPEPPPEPSPPEPPEPPPEPEPVRFGFLSGLSGDYSYWGPASLDGAMAGIGEINANGGVLGRPLELVVEDNLSTAEGAVAGYDRIREEIHALGGLESDGAVALLEAVAEDEMPTMCPVCGTTILDAEGGNFVWRLTASDSTFGVMSAQLARDQGYTRVALLVQQAEGTESPANAFRDVWENEFGDEITADVRLQPGQDSYQAEVEQALGGDPDAVYVAAGPRAGVPILREYIAQGHAAAILISADLLVPEFAEVATELPIGQVLGVIMTDDFESPAYDTFVAAHLEYAGKRPPTGFLEANQYDQYIALALAMTAAGSTDGPAVAAQVPRVLNPPGTKVYSYADGVAALARGEEIDYDGASGPLEINETGNVISLPVSIYHVVFGEFASPGIFLLDPELSR